MTPAVLHLARRLREVSRRRPTALDIAAIAPTATVYASRTYSGSLVLPLAPRPAAAAQLVPVSPSHTLGLWPTNGLPVAIVHTDSGVGAYCQLPPSLAVHLPKCGPCRHRLVYNLRRAGVPVLADGPDSRGWIGFTADHPWDLWSTPDGSGPVHPTPGWSQRTDTVMWSGQHLVHLACVMAACARAALARPCARTRRGRRVLVRLNLCQHQLARPGHAEQSARGLGDAVRSGRHVPLRDQPPLEVGLGEAPAVADAVAGQPPGLAPADHGPGVDAQPRRCSLGADQVLGRGGGVSSRRGWRCRYRAHTHT